MTFFNVSLYSQQNNIRFKRITVGDGLSQSNVQCIFQCSKGFLWVGTQDGLNKFDGYDFTIYRNNPKDTLSISGNRIENILEDASGTIWIATFFNGLCSYNRTTDKFTQYKHDPANKKSIFSNDVRGVALDGSNDLWVFYLNGLGWYDRERNEFINDTYEHFFNTDETFVIHNVTDYSANELIFNGNLGTLFLYNKQNKSIKRISYPKKDQKPGNVEYTNCLIDSNKDIWVFGVNHGLYQLNHNFKFIKYFGKSAEGSQTMSIHIRDFVEINDGSYWLGTDGEGVNVLDKNQQKVTIFKNDPSIATSIAGNAVYDIYVDKTGIVWLSHFSEGISYYDKNAIKFNAYFHNPDDLTTLSDKPILSVYEDSKNRIWVGTDGGGLNLFDKNSETFQHFTKEKNGLSTNVITAISQDSKGNLLLGTWNGGLMIYNPNSGKVKTYKIDSPGINKIPSNHVWAIKEDKNGNIWLGILGVSNIYIFNPTTEQFLDYSELTGNPAINTFQIMTILEDSKNNIWLGSEGSGVYEYLIDENKLIQHIHDSANINSLVNNVVLTLFEDHNGNIWMGTQSKGLSIYNIRDKTYTTINTSNGLPSDVIQGIVEDKNHTFWISTAKGICHYNPNNNTFRNYSKEDGLQGVEFKYNASLLASDGMIYIGGLKGLNVFNPDSIKDNLVIPPVYFTDFKLFDIPVETGGVNSILHKHISETDTITLTYEQNVFTISYVALNYTSTKKNQYAYKMIGFDKDYRSVGSIRDATYTNLDPGTYIFHVK
ncbi:MAG: triple tyrosine motif-containing protein, partial [Salinivirgaceae bacterium]|nr:triple tyrosine motif-containing protein [Salinivirgaceae bacterium]